MCEIAFIEDPQWNKPRVPTLSLSRTCCHSYTHSFNKVYLTWIDLVHELIFALCLAPQKRNGIEAQECKNHTFFIFVVRKTERVWLKLKRSWKTFLLCSMKVLLPIPSMSYRISAFVSNLIILGSELDLNLSVPLLFSKVFLYRLWMEKTSELILLVHFALEPIRMSNISYISYRRLSIR